MTTADDIAFWRPCWYCGLPLDDDEPINCVEHGHIALLDEPDPARPNLLAGIADDAVASMSAYLFAELPELVAGEARLWAEEHGFDHQDAGDYAGRAAGACRAIVAEVGPRQTSMLLEERRQRNRLLHRHLCTLAAA